MNQLKKLIVLVLLILVIQFKKTDCNTKISEIENEITADHAKYVTTLEFDKSTSKIFFARLE